jgi:arylsulfatase A-like enzyme
MRRHLLWLISGTLISSPLLTACRDGGSSAPVILVSIDTLRADHVGCYGYGRPTTPHVDLFRRDAILFSQTIAQAPSTLPSHASMLTSLLPPHHTASVANNRALPAEVLSLATILKRHGYATASFNGGVQLHAVWGLDQGFETYESVRPQKTASDSLSDPRDRFSHTLDMARDWIERHRAGPFFLFLHSYEVHHPYTPDAADLAPFRGDYSGRLPDHISVDLLREINGHKTAIDDKDRQHIVDAYDGEIHSMDAAFGRLVDLLRKNDLYDRSLVIFTSDHGEEFGEHGSMGRHAHTLFDELLRVPLLIKLPGSRLGGTTQEAQAQGIDLAPTVLGVLRLPVPGQFEGRDLLNPTGARRDEAVSTRDVLDPNTSAAVRTTEWKLYDGRLFHLSSDIPERLDVARDNLEVARTLRSRLKAILGERPIPSKRAAAPDEELQERLRALGYVQ